MSNSLNKTLLKKFAVEARNELREKVALKASIYGITLELSDKDRKTQGEEGFLKNEDVVINFNNEERTLSKEEATQRTALIKKIQMINSEDRDGFNEVIEEVAYTWFNRFVALRYMEVNRYLPSRINVLASKDNTNTPEILSEAMNVNLPIDKDLVYKLKMENKNEDLYRYLVELQCRELNKSLPFMFEKVGHYAELLFPAGVISSKFFRTLVDIESITEEAWSNVEIIGWLYQYYISEEKDRVIKAKKKYKKNEIPFATQLFTPDWIVRYMVQNSLGRYWIESHKEDEELKENWEFYLENPQKEPDFDEKIAPYINKDLEVEDIKCFDPACGSGHILVYMFDVLHEIYTRCGYSKGDIPMLIIEKNLYGLDIDTRAYQLACFAVIMKGMEYDKLLLRKIEREVDRRGKYIDLNIACVKETNILFEDKNTTLHENIAFLAKEESGEVYEKVKAFVESLKNASTFGSLTKIEGFDKEFLENRLEEMKNSPGTDLFGNRSREIWESILENLIKQAIIIKKTYDVLVTNPPYIGIKYMEDNMKNFVEENYSIAKYDLFSIFIEMATKKVGRAGQIGLITPFVWMFTFSYNNLRKYIIDNKDITSLIQLEYSAFGDATVPICTFTMRNYNLNMSGEYIKLSNFKGSENQPIKTLEAINNKVDYRYGVKLKQFKRIKGFPFGYWLTEKEIVAFEKGIPLEKIGEPKSGLMTGNNDEFLRLWFEVSQNKIGYGMEKFEDINKYGKKWFPYHKGGAFRKWYGNNEYIINMENEGYDIKFSGKNKNYRLRDSSLYFREGLTWSDVNSSYFGVRYSPKGYLFDMKGSMIFIEGNYNIKVLTAILCSKIVGELIKVLNPTISFQVNDIKRIPILEMDTEREKIIEDIVNENIELSKYEWDQYETSWDFKNIPLFSFMENGINESLESYINKSIKNIDLKILELKNNEEKLNEILIDLYGLNESIDKEVEEKYITLRRRDKIIEVKCLISYFIGCLFGRYSVDKKGLIFAGGDFNIKKYNRFIPSESNIVPILNSEVKYFEDDVMNRFEEFLNIEFGKEYLSENIDFIANVIGKKSNESSREAIRKYFFSDFFKQHCSDYSNRPIYWLFTSGKSKAFSCLVYQHRIDKNLLSKMRIDYVQPLQNKLEIEQKDLINILESDATAKDKREAKNKLKLVEKQIDELKVFHEKLRHMADKQIEIDLDDGVVYNHSLFGDLVAKIK